jgi:hypothetical protein
VRTIDDQNDGDRANEAREIRGTLCGRRFETMVRPGLAAIAGLSLAIIIGSAQCDAGALGGMYGTRGAYGQYGAYGGSGDDGEGEIGARDAYGIDTGPAYGVDDDLGPSLPPMPPPVPSMIETVPPPPASDSNPPDDPVDSSAHLAGGLAPWVTEPTTWLLWLIWGLV